MRPPPATPDLSGLARMAQNLDPALRNLVLAAEAKNYASAQSWGRASKERFEALALGLIPLVTSDVLADVARLLLGVAEPPTRVLASIGERLEAIVAQAAPDGPRTAAVRRAGEELLHPSALLDLVATSKPELDLALARNPSIVLDGWALAPLVERARACPDLARALLARDEPSWFDRASLYRFGDAAQRAAIRASVELRGATLQPVFPPLPADVRSEVIGRAAAADRDGVVEILNRAVGAPDTPSGRLAVEAEAECFALALRALGLDPDDCTTVFLTIDPRLARSVATVFHLRQIVLATTRAAALEIVASIAGRPRRPRPVQAPSSREEFATFDRSRRAAPSLPAHASGARSAAHAPRRLAPSRPEECARVDHQPRATIGRDRS